MNGILKALVSSPTISPRKTAFTQQWTHQIENLMIEKIALQDNVFFYMPKLNGTFSLLKTLPHPQLFLNYDDLTIHISQQNFLTLMSALCDEYNSAVVLINVKGSRMFEDILLGNCAKRMYKSPNAGGSSILSEVLSIELLSRLLGLRLSKTEMEIVYWPCNGPITDYTAYIPALFGTSSRTIGVSVTRAMAYGRRYIRRDAERLLLKKLLGVNLSSNCLQNEYINRQILHIWTRSGRTAKIVREVAMRMHPLLLNNTIVLISTVNSGWVFTNGNENKEHLIR